MLKRNTLGWFVKAGGTPNSRADDIDIKIYKNDELVEEGNGNWLSHVQFGEKVYWKIDENMPEIWSDVSSDKLLLESDSTRREDLHAIKAEDWESAEAKKL